MAGSIKCWSPGPAEISSHFAIRHRVFVDEQGVMVLTDIDPLDHYPSTIHVLAASGEAIAGTVRLYPVGNAGRWKGDRLAVLPAHRASLIGVKLVRYAVSRAAASGGVDMEASVQTANTSFFEHLGWRCDGPIRPYFGLPHQPMIIDLADVPAVNEARPLNASLSPLADLSEQSPLLVAS